MLVISRKTGELLHADPLTEDQRKEMAMAIFKAFCDMNRELVSEEVKKALAETD